MKYLSFLALVIAFTVNAFSQRVVISEYFNQNNYPNGEWTEFIILEDNTSLANCIFRDNATGLNAWQGGVKFKDVPLWHNLKRGTIIVLEHRYLEKPETLDKNASDGYLHISALDEELFTQYTPTPDPEPGRPWTEKALNIANPSDIMQICEADGTHIHSLSHYAQQAGSMWQALPNPKPNMPTSAAVLKSVAIFPGANKNAYLGIGGSLQVESRDSTMGLPNSSANSLYWRSIREPQWSSTGNMTVDIQPDGNLLTWTASEEVNDDIAGYTIIRYKKSEVAGVIHPTDGTIYGSYNESKLGTAKFIRNVVNTTNYKDQSDLPCGDEYEYRVYAYRFNSEGKPEEAIEANAHGRSYNTNTYAVKSFNKKGPDTPKLLANGKEISLPVDTILVCIGNTAKLEILDDAAREYKYAWYKIDKATDKKIDGATTKNYEVQYTNTFTEQYYGAIYDATYNCYVYTNKVLVKYLIAPEITIAVNKKVLTKDTTIYICKNDNQAWRILTGAGYDEKEFEWYLNNSVVQSQKGKPKYTVTQDGTYQLKASNSGTCTAASFKVNIVLVDPEFTITPQSLTYSLNANESSSEQKVTIENKRNYPLEIREFGGATNFVVTDPSLPFTIPASAMQEFTIRYLPASSGKVIEVLKCYAVCGDENSPVILNVEGTKVPSVLERDKPAITFDTLLTCENKVEEEVVTLTNTGSEAITINKPSIAAPYEIIDGVLPITLSKQNDKVSITIRFNNNSTAADYKQDLKIPYTVGGVNYEILVALSGVIAEPELEFEYPEIADTTIIPIATFTDAITSQQYEIEVTNSGNTDVTITKPVNDQGITFDYVPATIAAGASDVIKVTVNHSGVTPTEYPFTLNTDPCGNPYHLKLVCSTTGFVIDSVINYGYIAKCPSRIDPIERDITIKVLGTPESPFITDIVHSENFKLEIADGTPVSDGMKKIKVEFIGNAVKKYDEELKFTIKPMDKVYTIRVKAEVFEPKFDHFATLYFDDVKPGTTQPRSLRIINSNNPLPIKLTNISDPVPSGVFTTSEENEVPQTILPGDSIWVKFAYSPIVDGEERAQVRMKFEVDGCEYEDVVYLNGNTGQTIPLEVKFQAPTIVRLGTTINIPTYAKLDTTKDVKYLQAAIRKVEFDIEFNGSVLLPIEIVSESILIEAKNLVLTRIDDNSAKGSFEMSSRNMQDGKFFSIRSKFLWGNDTKAEIKLKNFKVVEAAKKFSVKDDSATIKIIGDCAFETGLLAVGEASGLGVTPRINSIDIEYNLVAEDYSTLEIYDAMGRNVYYNEVTNKQGAYSLSINQQLSNGTYIAILRNGNFPRIVKFVVNQ